MNFPQLWNSAIWKAIARARMPIVAELCSASWSNWREALKEVFVILFFSLMPLWLGLLIVNLLTITSGASEFITKFASSSDLGILSASLLGPMLYMMFREDQERTGNRITPGFPSGLWFIMLTVGCCMVATAIYCFTYLSTVRIFFNKQGSVVPFINSRTVEFTSWSLFGVVVLLILCAATIRNSIETQPPFMMSADTEDYVSALQAAQNGASNSNVADSHSGKPGGGP